MSAAFTLERALAELGLEADTELFRAHWSDSEATRPSGGPAILVPGEAAVWREYMGLPPELDAPLEAVARIARGRPALASVLWHCHRLLITHADYPEASVSRWSALGGALSGAADVFVLLAALSTVSEGVAFHQARGIPEAITRATLGAAGDLGVRARLVDGIWRVRLAHPDWFRRHVRGGLFRLGRLRFGIGEFWGNVVAYRNRVSREVVALVAPGLRLTEEGFIDQAPTADDAARGWQARLTITADTVRGHPVSPFGMAQREEVELPLSLWEPALDRQDPIIEVHIPGGGGMTLERCQEAMAQALEFFPRYFPELPFRGFACHSWVLNPDFEAMLGPESNMVQWQRELYLIPAASTGDDGGLQEAFGTVSPDPATAPRDTRLQRALLERLAAGRPVRVGAMFLLTEDFAHFGTQHYRAHWPPEF